MNYFAHQTAVIDEGCTIGDGTKIWHFSHVMPGCIIGKNCNIGQNVVVSPKVVLGDNVRVQNNVSIYEGVICEDDVFLGPSMVFTNVFNPRSAVSRKHEFMQTLVKKGEALVPMQQSFAGIILVNMLSLVQVLWLPKDVPAFALVMGNPAKQKGWMSEFGHKLEFNSGGIAVCPESGQEYELKDNKVCRIK